MSTEDGSRPAEVLLVEDKLSDVILTREAFKQAPLHVTLHHAKDGEECMAYLRKQHEYVAAPTPDIVLLDLNMPRMDGREVLAEIVSDESLRHLPVIILTTSSEEREVLNMYRLRCSSYIVKPFSFAEFVRIAQSIRDYWLTVATVPSS